MGLRVNLHRAASLVGIFAVRRGLLGRAGGFLQRIDGEQSRCAWHTAVFTVRFYYGTPMELAAVN